MKKSFIFILVLLSVNIVVQCQYNSSLSYYDSIKTVLIQQNNIEDLKMYHFSYKDGTIKRIYYTTPVDTSSKGCEWLTGPFYSFYKNGLLKFYFHVNPKSHVCDSLIKFSQDGQIEIVDIFSQNQNNPVLSSKLFRTGNCETDYYYPDSYIEERYFRRKGQITKEYLKYIDTSKGYFSFYKTIIKKFNYKKGIVKIKEKLPGGQITKRIENIDY